MSEEFTEEQKNNLKNFKTIDGLHHTGLIFDQNIKIVDKVDDRPLSNFPRKNTMFMKAMPKLGMSVRDGSNTLTVPDKNSYVSCCGATTNQNIGSCYMHAITNQAKWLVWMHTGIKYSPSNSTIDNDYAQGISGGMYYDIVRLRDSRVDNDEFIKAFRDVADKCGITKDNAADGIKYSGSGNNGKENAIKLLNQYGPVWYAHDCGLYYSYSGYHAIIFVGYDEEYAYFQNSWGSPAGNPKVNWSHFVEFNHPSAGGGVFFQTYGDVSGVNVWKDL